MKKILVVFASVFLSISSFGVYAKEGKEQVEVFDKQLAVAPTVVKNPDNVEENTRGYTNTTALTFSGKVTEEENIHEVEMKYYRNGEPNVKYYFEHPLNDNWSVYLSAFTTRGWDEITVGPVYNFTDEMSVGIGAGVSRYMSADEDNKSPHGTLSAFWFYKSDDWEAEVLVEKYQRDSVNPIYAEAYVKRKVTENVSVGAYAQNDIGLALRLDYKLSNNVSLWVAPVIWQKKGSDVSAVAGVSVSF